MHLALRSAVHYTEMREQRVRQTTHDEVKSKGTNPKKNWVRGVGWYQYIT